MIGDKFIVRPEYLKMAQEVIELFDDKLGNEFLAISIGGESGSGKSTLAQSLKVVLDEMNIKTIIFHMDDYFILPPLTNHQAREKDISNVGPKEVNLELMQAHLLQMKSGASSLSKPLVDYNDNSIGQETVDCREVLVLLLEGTYTSLIKDLDYRIFINRTYKETLKNRIERARDPISHFNE